jgi:hypothetical protein
MSLEKYENSEILDLVSKLSKYEIRSDELRYEVERRRRQFVLETITNEIDNIINSRDPNHETPDQHLRHFAESIFEGISKLFANIEECSNPKKYHFENGLDPKINKIDVKKDQIIIIGWHDIHSVEGSLQKHDIITHPTAKFYDAYDRYVNQIYEEVKAAFQQAESAKTSSEIQETVQEQTETIV